MPAIRVSFCTHFYISFIPDINIPRTSTLRTGTWPQLAFVPEGNHLFLILDFMLTLPLFRLVTQTLFFPTQTVCYSLQHIKKYGTIHVYLHPKCRQKLVQQICHHPEYNPLSRTKRIFIHPSLQPSLQTGFQRTGRIAP